MEFKIIPGVEEQLSDVDMKMARLNVIETKTRGDGPLGTPPSARVVEVKVEEPNISPVEKREADMLRGKRKKRYYTMRAMGASHRGAMQACSRAHKVLYEIEEKVRHVRDAEYWGLPEGTPITPGMKPESVGERMHVRGQARAAGNRRAALKGSRSTINALAEFAEGGGFTYHGREQQMITSGFVVALPGRSVRLGAGDVEEAAQQIMAFLDRPNPRARIIGGWLDTENNEIVLDYVQILDDREKAEELGRKRNQQAIFDLDNLEEIPTGGDGFREKAMMATKDAQGQYVFIERPDNWSELSESEKMDFAREAAAKMTGESSDKDS